MSSWEQVNEMRTTMFWMWVVSMSIAVTCALAGFVFGADEVRWPSAVFCLLGAHAMTAWLAFGRIANLQAALDMKRIALTSRGLTAQQHTLATGDTLTYDYGAGKLRITADRHVALTVEQLS